jgi:hypothetical protein
MPFIISGQIMEQRVQVANKHPYHRMVTLIVADYLGFITK